jgi:hypothetical protein
MSDTFIDGKLMLEQQQDTLNTIEQTNFQKVTAYAKKEPQPASGQVNKATLEDVPIGEQPPLLQLIAVGAGQTAQSVAAAQTTAGKTIAFQGIVFVDSKETTVIGVR